MTGWFCPRARSGSSSTTQLATTWRRREGLAPLKQAAFAVGGSLGVDLAIFFVRLGLEARLTETVTGLSPSGNDPNPGNVSVFQGLLSLRSAL